MAFASVFADFLSGLTVVNIDDCMMCLCCFTKSMNISAFMKILDCNLLTQSRFIELTADLFITHPDIPLLIYVFNIIVIEFLFYVESFLLSIE